MAESTWQDHERPVLEAVYLAEQQGQKIDAEHLVVAYDGSLEDTLATVHALVEADYLSGTGSGGIGWQHRYPLYSSLRLTERGRREIGQWPNDASTAFLEALSRLIAAEPDEAKRRKLGRLRDAAADVGKDALAGAMVVAGEIVLRG